MKDGTITPACEGDIPDLIELLGILFSINQDFTPTPKISDKAWRPLIPDRDDFHPRSARWLYSR